MKHTASWISKMQHYLLQLMLILKFDAPAKFICGNRRTDDAGTPPFAAGGSVQTMALSPSNFVFFVVCTPFKTSEVTFFNCSLTRLYDLTPLVVLCPVRSIISCSSTPASNVLQLFGEVNGCCSVLLSQQLS